MKLLIATLFLTLGTTFSFNEDFGQPDEKVLKRIARQVQNNWGQFIEIESVILANCKDHRQNLKQTYDDMKSCISRKNLFATPKQEYLFTIDQCSKDAISKTKNCLKNENKYFPEFLLSLTKSVVSFLYDDYNLLENEYYKKCVPKIVTPESAKKYLECVEKSTTGYNVDQIPSKASFCKSFVPATACFTELMRQNCENSPAMNKFRDDYLIAHKKPCDIH